MAAELGRVGPPFSLRDVDGEALDALLAQELLLAGTSSSEGSESDSDSGSDSDSAAGGGGRLPWALRNVPVLVSWTSLAAVFALQPPGRRIPPTLDLAITTVRLRCRVRRGGARRGARRAAQSAPRRP